MAERQHVFQVGIVGGKQGGSAVERAAYLFGKTFFSESYGQTYDHSDKAHEVIYTHVFAPEPSPGWVYDPYKLTNSIEQAETRQDAQFMRSVYLTLPITMTHAQLIALVNDYAHHFVKQGMVVICAIHDDGTGNPNMHFLFTMRQLSPEGTWLPKSYDVPLLNEHGEKVKRANGKYKTHKVFTTNWNNQGNCTKWRTLYQDEANRHLEHIGSQERVDLRSNKERGIDKIPKVRYSQTEMLLKHAGIGTECEAINQIIEAENQMREIEDRQRAERRAKAECDIAQLKAKFRRKRKYRWKPSPQRKVLQDFWSEVREKESQITLALTHVWHFFKEEVSQILHDVPHPPHHERHVQEGRRPLSKET